MKNPIPTLTLLALTAGAAAGAAQFAKGGKAELRDSQGKIVGSAQLKVVNEGVQVSVHVTGIPAGTHAFHRLLAESRRNAAFDWLERSLPPWQPIPTPFAACQ